MGNHIVVMNGERKQIGSMNLSLGCYAVVNRIVKKYNGKYLPVFGGADEINNALDSVYKRCQKHEEVQLHVFINDKSVFDESDTPSLDYAIATWEIENDGPKKCLEFIRSLIQQHGTVLTEYSGLSTCAITVTN